VPCFCCRFLAFVKRRVAGGGPGEGQSGAIEGKRIARLPGTGALYPPTSLRPGGPLTTSSVDFIPGFGIHQEGDQPFP